MHNQPDYSYTYVTMHIDGHVAIITLNRPSHLNALCQQLIADLGQCLDHANNDNSIYTIIITGSEKAFAAGADISEMQHKTFSDCYIENFITHGWEAISQCRKPVIAAVAGYALGGGCEVAMMCDIIIAADNAKFGQPEITIGTIPGAGGTQRLARVIGKSKTMDMVLTGRMMDAVEAERAGLVSKIVPLDNLLGEALAMAHKIASHSQHAVFMAKEAVNQAYEVPLQAGLHVERRLFYASFATHDQKEGMQAFIEKRPPEFNKK